ncbi:MAG: TonB-dependent receptor [Bacteroidales bacterium]|nr:TonB-dependent receptor [Bacteroidales bacterium]
MKKYYSLFAILILTYACIFAQTHVSGYVYDANTKETIIGANVLDTIVNSGTSTNTQGYFSLIATSPVLKISFIGYETSYVDISVIDDNFLNIYLKESIEQLKQVEVSAQVENYMNAPKLDIKDIKNLPAIGGQPDVLRATRILPGIQTQNEISSLLIIRGGDPGQNMYLLDDIELLSVNHLGGIMSVFNPDIIKDVQIYKGGFPAKYGGKLSSIVDITQRNGNASKFNGSLGIGITDLNLSLEGKLGSNTTYIINGRKTAFDPLLYGLTSIIEGNASKMFYGFYDASMKISWTANDKNKFHFNVFQGDDYIHNKSNLAVNNTEVKAKKHWGNFALAGSWNSTANSRLFGKTVLSYTRYRVKDFESYSSDTVSDYKKRFLSSVDNLCINSNWTYRISNAWRIDAGLHSSFGYYTPYNYRITGESSSFSKVSNEIFNNAVSLSNKLDILNFFKADIGVRATNYTYSDVNEFILEPRLNISFNMKKYGLINIDYMHVSQTSHLFLSPGIIYVNETWLPASKGVPVSKSKQYSVSWSKNFHNNMFAFSVGAYHKDMSDLITAKSICFDATSLEKWESIVETNGVGTVQGIELMLKKNYGRWTGIISYHLSHATRQFENINNGETYVYEFNRPHDFSIFASYELNEKWTFSVAWCYQSGLPHTPVIGRQMIFDPNREDGYNYYEAFIYGERNSEQMKDFHRLDIGFTYKTLTKKSKLPCEWTFSLYNAYNRHNPNYYYYNNNDGQSTPQNYNTFIHFDMYQMSIFPIIPGVSYKVFFGKEDVKNKFKNLSLKNWLNYEN